MIKCKFTLLVHGDYKEIPTHYFLSCFRLTVEFSSIAKFMKFVLNFDLSKLVTDGDIPFTVVRKIGHTRYDVRVGVLLAKTFGVRARLRDILHYIRVPL